MLSLVSSTIPRLTVGAEVRNFLPLTVLVDAEIVLCQPLNEPARSVGDAGRHVDQLDAGLELERSLILLLLLPLKGRGGQDDGDRGGIEQSPSQSALRRPR
jgi:hypothetical protein